MVGLTGWWPGNHGASPTGEMVLGLEKLWEAGKPVELFTCPGERRPEPFQVVAER